VVRNPFIWPKHPALNPATPPPMTSIRGVDGVDAFGMRVVDDTLARFTG
jgi:hypothetical protein